MLIDLVHQHPREPAIKTRYRDPAMLRAYGYDATVIRDALPALAAANPEAVEALAQRVSQARAAGLQVFFYADAVLLSRRTVESNPEAYECADGSHRLCPAKPAVLAAYGEQVEQLFARFPEGAGLIVRTSEVQAETTPHLVGNTLLEPSCPACRGLSTAARLRAFVAGMAEVVVARLDRSYVHRTWQRHGPAGASMHDDPDIYREVTAGLPQSDKLCFAFKFTRGDFRRQQPFNPCLTADTRPKWIEFQCEREYEGKGAFPNYQPVLWAEFLQQLQGQEGGRETAFSFWSWSRGGEGGGWGGPYVQREEWIDANVVGLAELARQPGAEPGRLARQWAAGAFGIDPAASATGKVAEILLASPGAIRALLYDNTPVRATVGLPATDTPWVMGDQLDVEALWDSAARLLDGAAAEAACREKLGGLAAVERMRQLFDQAAGEMPNKAQARDVANTLIFYNSFAGTVAHLFVGFVRYFQWQRSGKTEAALAEQAVDHLEHAQHHWQHNTQRHALLPGAPSVFQETTFWERTNTCLEELQVV